MMSRSLSHLGVLVVFVILSSSNVAPTTMTDNQIMEYLEKYGYLDNEIHAMSDEAVKEAIRTFQHKAGVKNPTGDMDNFTREMMLLPRCGIQDFRARRRTWPKKALTYKINSYTSRIPNNRDTARTFQQAFDYWSAVTDLTFTSSTSNTADIQIGFKRGEHNDGARNQFDGAGGILAHAFFPTNGNAHFDESERWTLGSQGTNLLQVATHEFGHLLGLEHSEVREAVMAPFYQGYERNFRLKSDDISRIQYLYGRKRGGRTTTRRPRPPSRLGDLEPPNELCQDASIDAALSTPDQKTFFFKGMQFWEVYSRGLVDGYPRMINSRWSELPSSLDAAFTSSRNNKTYFFKGMMVWRYKDLTLDNDYPKKISVEFPGLYLNNVDTAFEWSGDSKIHFFRAGKHWCHADGNICPDYPKPMSEWGLPDQVNAAIRYNYQGYRMYFFKDTQFYRFDDRSSRVTAESPLNTVSNWFQCPPQTVQ